MHNQNLQQNAFMWFKSRYGKTPQDAGYKTTVLRTKRLFFFWKYQQVVFAQTPDAAQAFAKEQTILEKVVSYFIPTLLIMLGLFCLIIVSLATLHKNLALIGTLSLSCIGIGALIALAYCYKKAKPLEKIYKGRVTIYTV